VKIRILLAIVLAILVYAGTASADPIGGPNNTNCLNNSCDGALYTLTYSGTALPDADTLHETFRISLAIDTNSYTGGGVFLDNVAIKVGSSTTSVSLFAAPGGTGNWSSPTLDSGIDNSGCSAGGNGFFCVDGLANGGKGVAVTTGNGVGTDFTFTFDVTVPNGDLLTAATIKARYTDSTGVGHAGSLLSEDITLQTGGTDGGSGGGDNPQVPEPSTMLLLGSGLVLMGRMIRRKK
jgi:hypothetical protein